MSNSGAGGQAEDGSCSVYAEECRPFLLRWPDRVLEVLARDDNRAWILLADAGTPMRAP